MDVIESFWVSEMLNDLEEFFKFVTALYLIALLLGNIANTFPTVILMI